MGEAFFFSRLSLDKSSYIVLTEAPARLSQEEWKTEREAKTTTNGKAMERTKEKGKAKDEVKNKTRDESEDKKRCEEKRTRKRRGRRQG